MNQAETAALDSLSDEQLTGIAEQLFQHGATLADLRGLTNDEMEAVYLIAYNFYQQGKIEEAEKVFHFLCLYGHLDKRFWMGLAACRQQLKQYQQAIAAYSYLAVIDTENPYPPMHAADCYLALNDLDNTESALHATLHWAGDKNEFAQIKQRAQLMLHVVKDKKEKVNESIHT